MGTNIQLSFDGTEAHLMELLADYVVTHPSYPKSVTLHPGNVPPRWLQNHVSAINIREDDPCIALNTSKNIKMGVVLIE